MFQKFCEDALARYKGSPSWKKRPHEEDWTVPSTAEATQAEHELNTFVRLVILPKYSLICGTSIGGLNALMLCYGVPLTLIIDSFRKYRDDIFLASGSWFSYHVSKYSDAGLKETAAKIIGRYRRQYPEDRLRNLVGKGGHLDLEELTLQALLYPCGVTTFDLNSQRTWLLNRDENPKILLIDALLATSAAPSYFPIHNFKAEMHIELDETGTQVDQMLQLACVDGGVFANDPRLVALKHLRLRSGPETLYYFLSFGKSHLLSPPSPHLALPSRQPASRWFSQKLMFLSGTGTSKNPDRPPDKIWTDQLGLGESLWNLKPEQAVGIGAWLRGSSQCPSLIEVFMGSAQIFAEQTIRDLARTGQLHSNKIQFIMEKPIELDEVKKMSELKVCVDNMQKKPIPAPPKETEEQQKTREATNNAIAEEQYLRYVQPVKKFFSDCVEIVDVQK
jgi:hypothetical protein